MIDARLRDFVQELNDAESEHLNDEGPPKKRLHQAIVALCDDVGIQNKWNTEE
jgi:hypothetical protein